MTLQPNKARPLFDGQIVRRAVADSDLKGRELHVDLRGCRNRGKTEESGESRRSDDFVEHVCTSG